MAGTAPSIKRKCSAKKLLFRIRKSKRTKEADGGSPAPDSKPRTATFKRAFKRAAFRAGMKDLSFHDCRRIFLNRLRERGVPVDIAIKLSAHTSLETVMKHYREIQESATREAVRMLDLDEASAPQGTLAQPSRDAGEDMP